MHPRVDLPDGSYTLVLEGGVEGVDGELQYMDVAQDPRPTLLTKASPGSLTLLLLQLCNYLCYVCAFTFQELN
jgi:hypothetical protein